MFQDKSTQNGQTAKSADSMAKRSHSLLHIFADERDRWLSVLDPLDPQETHQPEKPSTLLTWIEQQLETAQSPPEADTSSIDRTIPLKPFQRCQKPQEKPIAQHCR